MTHDPLPWETPPDDVEQPPRLHPEPEPVEVVEDDTANLPAVNLSEELALGWLLDDLTRDPRRLSLVTAQIRDAAVAEVQSRAVERRQARLARLDGGDVESPTDVRREAVGAANDHDVLFALASAILAGATEAKAIAGELVAEVPGAGGRPRASIKVADGTGFELAVTVAKRNELSVDVDEIVSVLIGALISSADLKISDMPVKVYALGLDAGIAAFRDVLSTTPSFRKTALDSVATRLEDADDEILATRLRKAYGNVEKGEPSVKLDRKPLPDKAAKA